MTFLNIAEMQSYILNRDVRKGTTTLLLARTDKSKANYYNVYFYDHTGELHLFFYGIRIPREILNSCNDDIAQHIIGYRTNYVNIYNLSI